MSKVFTANIFITNSRLAIEQVFFSKTKVTSAQSLMNTLSKEDLANSFIMSPASNNGILNFEHNYMSGGGDAPPNTFTFRMLETSKLLSLFLMDNDVMAQILSNRLKTFSKKYGDTKVPFQKDENQLTALEVDGIRKKFYVAYGVGDDVSRWSGPHVAHLAGATLTNGKANERFVDIVLVPNDKSMIGQPGSNKFADSFGYSDHIQRMDSVLSYKDKVSARGSYTLTSEHPDWRKPNLDLIWREVLRRYIESYTGSRGNTIIAFPDSFGFMNLSPSVNLPFIAIPSKWNAMPFDPVKVTKPAWGIVSDKSDIRNKIDYLQEKLNIGLRTARTAQKPPNTTALLGISTELEGGLDTSPEDKLRQLAQINPQASWDLQQEIAAEYHKIYRSVHEGDRLGWFSNFYIETVNNTKSTSKETFEHLYTPLVKFANWIRDDSNHNLSRAFNVMEETDIRLLKLWKQYGFIENDDEPAYIFGDTDFIQRCLHPEPEKNISNLGDNYPGYLGEDFENSLKYLFTEQARDSEVTREGVPFEAKRELQAYAGAFRDLYKLDDGQQEASDFEFQSDLDSLNLGKEVIKELTRPDILLKHNISNPNVIQLNYNVDSYFAALMDLDVRPSLDWVALGSTRLAVTKKSADKIIKDRTLTKIRELFKKDESINITKVVDKIFRNSKNLLALSKDEDFRELLDMDHMELAGYISFLVNFDAIKSNEESKLKVTTSNPERIASIRASMYSKIRRYLNTVTLEALPFFNRAATFGKTVALVGKTGGIIGGDEGNRSLAPYTGLYTVAGFTHVISPGDIHSEFQLVRANTTGSSELSKKTVKSFVCAAIENELSVARKDMVLVVGDPTPGAKIDASKIPLLTVKEQNIITDRFWSLEELKKQIGCSPTKGEEPK